MRNWFGSIFAIGIDPEGLLRSFGGLATVALFGVIFAESTLFPYTTLFDHRKSVV